MSARFVAGGFSRSTEQPASSSSTATSVWLPGGVATDTRSGC